MPSTETTLPLGVLPDRSLSREQVETLQAIDRADLWFVEERLVSKVGATPEGAREAIQEFKRYMALVGLGYRGLGMASPLVDEAWHTFILFTKDYAAFCQVAFGEFIHHVPRTSRDPQTTDGTERFVRAYREVFGDLSTIWGERIPYAKDDGAPSGCGTEDCTDS
jgi:hypothetical protein